MKDRQNLAHADGIDLVTFGQQLRHLRRARGLTLTELGEAATPRISKWAVASRLRRIVLRVSPTWPLTCFYLHWSDGADLNALDDRVASGSAADGDFAGAVVGEALGMHHRACGAALRVVALDSVLPLFTNDVERSRAHVYQAACPACGEPWSASVLEFIGTT